MHVSPASRPLRAAPSSPLCFALIEAQAAPGHVRLSLFFLCDILPPHLCLSSVPPSKAARGPGLIPSRTPGQLTSSWGLKVGPSPNKQERRSRAPA
ncbi:hypothetical protein Q5P01_005802 [Channa striata]|uniref:Uncharacterized protein n=1 Tax=Channa striata TaxID=64152 RepID=A0AA88T7P5_CHASR|nr:hypothetical protein Q5P01_005802 [Channa striata]